MGQKQTHLTAAPSWIQLRHRPNGSVLGNLVCVPIQANLMVFPGRGLPVEHGIFVFETV